MMRGRCWMRRAWLATPLAVLLGGGLAGCSMVGTGDGDHAQLGSLGASPPAGDSASSVAAPEHVSMGSFLEGPVGSRLGEADREAAFKAESQAVSTGERKTWRGAKGVYGFVVPAVAAPAAQTSDASPDASGGECRSFTHTVYFAGRPQTGRGKGCRDADGTWRIVS